MKITNSESHFFAIYPKLHTEYTESGAKDHAAAGFLLEDKRINDNELIKHPDNGEFGVNNAGLYTFYPESGISMFTSLAMLELMPTFGLKLPKSLITPEISIPSAMFTYHLLRLLAIISSR